MMNSSDAGRSHAPGDSYTLSGIVRLNFGALQTALENRSPISFGRRKLSIERFQSGLGVFKDGVRGLFSDHVDRACDKESGNAREDRSIHDAQAFRAVNTKAAV
jgi:hypothetical protein